MNYLTLVLRLFDLFLALFLLLVFLPLFLLTSLAIVIESGSPIFFVQPRVGLHRVQFRMFKFRSMYHDPDRSVGGLDKERITESYEAYQTTVLDDPRITPVGKFIRRYHLDEIPQLINVIFGDMSVVGPRPDAGVQEIEYEESDWEKRHTMKPGITGLAQVSQIELDFDARLERDLAWINDASVSLYLEIIRLTVLKVLRGNSF